MRLMHNLSNAAGHQDAIRPLQQGLGIRRLDLPPRIFRQLSELTPQLSNQHRSLALSHALLPESLRKCGHLLPSLSHLTSM